MTIPTGSKEEMEGGPELPCGAKIAASEISTSMEGWRPIETAPNDGTHILACDARVPYGPTWTFDQRPPVVIHWWGGPVVELSQPEAGFYRSHGAGPDEEPYPATHWMPLPLPPRDELNASLKSREAPTLPSREELERALRETLPFLRMQAHDAMNPKPLQSLIAQISALTSKEQSNG